MRRKGLGFLLVSLLLLPSAVEGQCRKRILVFLDVSGSMRPTNQSSSSPFQQSLAALQTLMREPKFIEPNDVLEVVRFGSQVRARDRAQGRDNVNRLLEALRMNTAVDRATDFRAYLANLAEALGESSSYNSQVVLLGSDLVHEPVNGMPAAAALQDWGEALSEYAEARQTVRDNSQRTAYVIFVPNTTGRYQPVQDKVFEDLGVGLPRVEKVTPEQAGQGGLAAKLLHGLLTPPSLTISRDAQDSKKLAFIVNNPNCRPLRLTELRLQRITAEGPAEPVPYPVDASEPGASLGRTGSPEATGVLTRPLPTGGEWEGVSDLRGEAETEEGLIGKSNGTAGTWLKYQPVRGVLERYLLVSPALRLDLRLQGTTVEPRTYRLVVRTVGASEEAGTLAEAKFSSPEAVDAIRPNTLRIVVPTSRDLHRQIAAQTPFRVEINGAQLIEAQQDRVEILEDSVANRSNLFILLASGLALLATVYSFFRVKGIASRYQALAPGRNLRIGWLVTGGLALLPLAMNLFHLWLLRRISAAWVDWLAVGFSVAAVFVSLTFGLQRIQAARFGRRVLSAAPPLTLAKYHRSSALGVWLPWMVGLAATSIFVAAWFLVRPPVSANLGRDANPPQLRVVKD